MPKQLTPKIAIDRAQWLCSQRERCMADIKTKLTQWGIGADDAQVILKSLVSDGFINESRFAITFARDKARFNKWGPRKIEMALRAKRISKEHIDWALGEIQEFTNTENLFELLAKKTKTIKYKDAYDLKTKLIRFALSRGFNYEEVMSVVGKIVKQ